ncbi:MAG: glycogen-debranching protein [Chloroflexales bacterium]|nr:glycogen-debranching protein [Chloroflexales bacterium]
MAVANLSMLRTVEAWERDEGVPVPLGATWIEDEQAYNFALYSRHATGVTLLLYAEDDLVTPVYQQRLDPYTNKTQALWHCWIPASSTRGARYYAYRVEGPEAPERGYRFNPAHILLDPYAREVFFPPNFSREAAARAEPNDGRAPLGVLPRASDEVDLPDPPCPRHTHDLVIYELHVKGFTARANSGVSPDQRGTFLGLVAKIPYLQELGVTAVELLPVHQYDPQEGNYWGYMTLNFFAPHAAYACANPFEEFRAMVRAFHAAGIEVLLDVVYNHTCEGDEHGSSYSYRGIDNSSYYLLTSDRRRYNNDTGCGNTMNSNDPAVRWLVLSSLQHWRRQLHVDGFRFDLASILSRNPDGSVNQGDATVITEISLLGAVDDSRLIAEAWDIGAYQLGRGFPGRSWMQWNGKFRDDIRAFVKGDGDKVSALMTRLYGSDDLFPADPEHACHPSQSVNFITAHDGFCLYDLTAYNDKHNEANGHDNSDGANDNASWNCGWEGDAGAPPEVLELRRRQVKNLFSLLMLANGTPMFCAGDEFLNTQGGNNNPYNQDNEITWLDWDLLERNRDVFRFFKTMIAFRKAHPSLQRSRFWGADVSWYGTGREVDMSPASHTLAYCLRGASQGDDDLYVMINSFWEELIFMVQEGEASEWLRVVDTSHASPHDIAEPGREQPLAEVAYRVGARSVVVLRRPRGKG